MAVIYQEDFNAIANGTELQNVAGWVVDAEFPLTEESVVVNNGKVDIKSNRRSCSLL